MWRNVNLLIVVLCFWGVLGNAQPAAADFVELEKLFEEPAQALAEKLADQKVVVAARELSKIGGDWAVHQAAGVELTMALRRLKIDAVRASADTRLEKLDTLKTPFTVKDAKLVKDADRTVLVGVEWTSAPKLKLRIVAYSTNPEKSLSSEIVTVPSASAVMAKNIPRMNAAVIEYAREQLGKAIGSGGHYDLPEAGLMAAGATRRGYYRWGRELGPREPWLPGDILVLESVGYKDPMITRKFIHHAGVLDNIQADQITFLHQNAVPKGRIVQREALKFKGLDDGEIVAFRPWAWPEEPPLPTQHPIRFTLAKPVLVARTSTVDLLKTLDTRLDRIHGVWCIDNKILKTQTEIAGRIQIPVVPPQSYVLKMSVKRFAGTDQLGLGIVMDGHQTMVSIDGSEGQVTGLSNLDEKPAANNESIQTISLLTAGKQVNLVCRVEPGQIQLTVDGKQVLDWKGESKRLSVGPDFAVPNGEWLFLSASNSEFEISSFTMEPIAGK